MPDDKILSCGHKPSLHGEFTTGTAWFVDDCGVEREICWECAHKLELKYMREHGKLFAYLSCDGNTIRGWSGYLISNRIVVLSTMTDNFGGERTYLRFEFEGEIWSGFAMGRGAYGRFRRTKIKNLCD